MHEMQLWFLGIWKGHFSHLPKLNYGCKIKCLHSIIALAWFLFELIFDYFWSKNLSLYQNTILAILITYRNSIDFGPLHQFGLVQSTSTHFCQFWPNLIYFSQFNPIWSIQSIKSTLVILVLFSPFCPIWSIRPTSVQFGLFGPFQSTSIYSIQFGPYNPLRSIRSNLVHSVHLGLFNPIWSIRPISAHLGLFNPIWSIRSIWSISTHFDPIWCTYLRMAKYKFRLRILLIIWVISIIIIW